MLFWLSFEIFSDFQTPMKFSQANLNVWFSPVSQSLPGIHEETNCSMLTITGKSKQGSLNPRKLLKTKKFRVCWKIQNAIKSGWKEELGWNFQDLLLSMIPVNGQNLKQIGGYQFQTLSEVDWIHLKPSC